MRFPAVLAAGLSIAATALPAAGQALEPFKTYDNFNAAALDRTLWPGYPERVREIRGNALRLAARDYGGTTSDVGTLGTSTTQNLLDPTAIRQLRAKITVNAIDAQPCVANPSPNEPRARIYGDFFNIGTPTPGSQLNNVTAQVRVLRRSDSIDPPGVLRVEGIVYLCGDTPCLAVTPLALVDLGTAMLGQPVLAALAWDPARDRFLFQRDGAPAVPAGYTVPDSSPSGSPNVHIGVRNAVPNCTAAPAPWGYVDATFDDVAVNRSAAP